MKRLLSVALMTLLAAATLTGCYGKFSLTRKVYELNGHVSDKFLRSGLTWVFIIVPVYGVAALVDFIAFNTIEFWSGKNPVASGEKDFQYVQGDDTFRVQARKAGDTIDYTIHHSSGAGPVDTTLITWDIKSGKSVVWTNSGGETRQYQAGRDGSRVRVDQYAGTELLTVTYHPYPGSAAGQLALSR